MILLTGFSGFLGKYLLKQFQLLNRDVIKIGRGSDSDWNYDFKKCDGFIPLNNDVNKRIDLLVHAAGLAHMVPKNIEQAALFELVNAQGTLGFLSYLKLSGWIPSKMVFISTISVYGDNVNLSNTQYPQPFASELTNLQVSPYGRSKLNAEEIVREWCKTNGCECIIWRIPLIVGNNAPGNLGAMEKAIKNRYYFRIGNSYNRFRYFVNIGYIFNLLIGVLSNENEIIMKEGTHNVFSGLKSFGEFEDEFALKYNRKILSLPNWFVFILAIIGNIIPGFPFNYYRYKKLMADNLGIN